MPGGLRTQETVLTQMGLTKEDTAGRPFYYGKGCMECNETGYRGRKGLFELLVDYGTDSRIDQHAGAGRV